MPYTENGGNWNPPYDNGDYSDLSSGGINPQGSSFDRYDTFSNRSQNPNVRSNIPYYYFGLNPGKTAINKLKNNFFLEK